MTPEALHARRQFYSEHLTGTILPFWLDKTDAEHGGFFTCYDPAGTHLVSREKYVWSQGRCTWMYARLAGTRAVEMPPEMREKCAQLAGMGARFLRGHCILPDGTCAFRLSERNEPLELSPGSGYAVSTFADCFVIMGLVAYAALAADGETAQLACTLFEGVQERFRAGAFRTAPDVLPDGWRSHAAPMILMNTGEELALALRALGKEQEAQRADSAVQAAMEEIYRDFLQPEGIVLECLTPAGAPLETLYGRHLNPGHTNESMWLLMRAARQFGRADILQAAQNVVRHTSLLAWDEQYGGMLYYIDRDGGRPRGAFYEPERALADAALRDWSSKLWWPHTETMYANLCCWADTGDETFLRLYERCHAYTFSTFPNPDRSVGEWIQLRRRDGTPNDAPIGGRLPVKDPYHITRNLLLAAELLAKQEQHLLPKQEAT